MKKLTFIAALACIGLAACQPTPTPAPSNGTPVSEPSANVTGPASCGLAADTLVDERVLYAAEAAYNVPAHAYVTLDGAGQLSAELKASVRPKLVEAYRLLRVARSAYKLGDVCQLNEAASAATRFANEARALLPGSN